MSFTRIGQGRPLLLLHPFATSHVVWRPVIDRLASKFDVFAPTLSGHGSTPIGAQSVQEFADELERKLDDIGWDRVDIAGNSLGGLLALELGVRGRARTVTAIAPAGGWVRYSPAEARLAFFFLAHYPVVKLFARLTPYVVRFDVGRRLALFNLCHRTDRVAVDDARRTLYAASGCAAYMPLLWNAFWGRLTPELSRISCPVRFLYCEHDRVVPHPRYNVQFEKVAHATVEILAGVGHIPMLEAPELVADAILRHIRSARE
jgi:pimeloyl-ACP methyl ester carboxylesterase